MNNMININDEEILFGCYKRMGEISRKNWKEVDLKNDKEQISKMTSEVSVMLLRLTGNIVRLSMTEMQQALKSSKWMIQQYYLIKGRNPECIYSSLDKSMERLMRAVSSHEAEMLSVLRNQEENGDMIDIRKILGSKPDKLGTEFARDLVRRSINKGVKPLIRMERDECYVENANDDYVTAFVDESIHPVKWSADGHQGRNGSYSYIICSGRLTSEEQISEANQICSDVKYTEETVHPEQVTLSAIRTVLTVLAFEQNFEGNVQIYVDNQTASYVWGNSQGNAKLASYFKSVNVTFIPREMNKKADALGRTRVILNLPASAYAKLTGMEGLNRQLREQVKAMKEEQAKRMSLKGLLLKSIKSLKRAFKLHKGKTDRRDNYRKVVVSADERAA